MKSYKIYSLAFMSFLLSGGLCGQIQLFYGNGYDYEPDYNGSIHACMSDGTDYEVCFDGINMLYDIALDYTVEPKRIYYIERGNNRIRSANLDGSDKQDVITSIEGIYSLALDLSARKIYFTVDVFEDKVYGADMDGTDESLVLIKEYETSMFETLRGISVDDDMLYWIRGGISCNDYIYRCKTDGSEYETFVQNATPNVDMSYPHDLALTNNYVFWTDPGVNSDVIYRMNKDKTNPIKIATGVHASQIALDTENSKVYWTETLDGGKSKIAQANLDGTVMVDILTMDIHFPMGLIAYTQGSSANEKNKAFVNILRSYPNPFSTTSTIEYIVPGINPKVSHVNISIYDMVGNKVTVLVRDNKTPGIHKVQFDANDLASGIYFCQMDIENNRKVIPLVLKK